MWAMAWWIHGVQVRAAHLDIELGIGVALGSRSANTRARAVLPTPPRPRTPRMRAPWFCAAFSNCISSASVHEIRGRPGELVQRRGSDAVDGVAASRADAGRAIHELALLASRHGLTESGLKGHEASVRRYRSRSACVSASGAVSTSLHGYARRLVLRQRLARRPLRANKRITWRCACSCKGSISSCRGPLQRPLGFAAPLIARRQALQAREGLLLQLLALERGHSSKGALSSRENPSRKLPRYSATACSSARCSGTLLQASMLVLLAGLHQRHDAVASAVWPP